MHSFTGKSDDFLHLGVFICFSILLHAILILTIDIDFSASTKKYSALVLHVVLLPETETKEQKPTVKQEDALKKQPLKKQKPSKKIQPNKYMQIRAPEKFTNQQKSSAKSEVQQPEAGINKERQSGEKITGADLISKSMDFVHSDAKKQSEQKKYFYLPTPPLVISSQPLFIEHPEIEPGYSVYRTSSGDTRYAYISKNGKKRCFEYTTPDAFDQFPLAVFYIFSFGLNC